MTDFGWKFSFNKIYIIESLKDNERKTGRELNEDSLRYALMAVNSQTQNPINLASEYHITLSKIEFVKLLNNIYDETLKNGIGPLLHLEIHGSKAGLHFADGSRIEWREVADLFLKINIASRFNLFITLAVCWGGHLIRAIKPMSPVPFWGFVGAIQTISEQTIAEGFSEFYTTLLIEKNSNVALNRFNIVAKRSNVQFALVNSLKVFLYFFKETYSKDGIKQAIEGVLRIQPKQIIKELKLKHGKHNVRKFIKNEIFTPELKNRYMQKALSRTFLWEIIPENKERFNFTYKQLMSIREEFHYFW